MSKIKSTDKSTLVSSVAATFAAIAASLCCLGPVVLLSLGIGGSWMSSLSVFEPYRPVFIVVTIAFLLLAFYKLYIKPTPCVTPASLKKQRITFWLITVVVIALVTFPYYGLMLLN